MGLSGGRGRGGGGRSDISLSEPHREGRGGQLVIRPAVRSWTCCMTDSVGGLADVRSALVGPGQGPRSRPCSVQLLFGDGYRLLLPSPVSHHVSPGAHPGFSQGGDIFFHIHIVFNRVRNIDLTYAHYRAAGFLSPHIAKGFRTQAVKMQITQFNRINPENLVFFMFQRGAGPWRP